jgi:hypothetical protein
MDKKDTFNISSFLWDELENSENLPLFPLEFLTEENSTLSNYCGKIESTKVLIHVRKL